MIKLFVTDKFKFAYEIVFGINILTLFSTMFATKYIGVEEWQLISTIFTGFTLVMPIVAFLVFSIVRLRKEIPIAEGMLFGQLPFVLSSIIALLLFRIEI